MHIYPVSRMFLLGGQESIRKIELNCDKFSFLCSLRAKLLDAQPMPSTSDDIFFFCVFFFDPSRLSAGNHILYTRR